jgi:hypothetical protein
MNSISVTPLCLVIMAFMSLMTLIHIYKCHKCHKCQMSIEGGLALIGQERGQSALGGRCGRAWSMLRIITRPGAATSGPLFGNDPIEKHYRERRIITLMSINFNAQYIYIQWLKQVYNKVGRRFNIRSKYHPIKVLISALNGPKYPVLGCLMMLLFPSQKTRFSYNAA